MKLLHKRLNKVPQQKALQSKSRVGLVGVGRGIVGCEVKGTGGEGSGAG